jgi:hypothetical protein
LLCRELVLWKCVEDRRDRKGKSSGQRFYIDNRTVSCASNLCNEPESRRSDKVITRPATQRALQLIGAWLLIEVGMMMTRLLAKVMSELQRF